MFRFKTYTDQEAIEAVKQDGYALQYVKEQTEAICLEAVKQNSYALRYVKDLTEDICLAAVKQDGYALAYVKDQTEAVCLEAVKQDGYALAYVKDQTEAICLEAVKQNGGALRYAEILSGGILKAATAFRQEYEEVLAAALSKSGEKKGNKGKQAETAEIGDKRLFIFQGGEGNVKLQDNAGKRTAGAVGGGAK
jgi:biotin operon repressor